MGASVIDDADITIGVTEGYQVLAQQPQTYRRTVRLR
jgi:hypothetical protein